MLKKLVLGIDVGGTNVKTALVNQFGDVLQRLNWPMEAMNGPEKFALEVHDKVSEMLQEAEFQWSDIGAAGVGLPAFLDIREGKIEQAVNLHWTNVPIVTLLADCLQVPVVIDNDANLAALGEVWLGAGKQSHSALCVTLGTGIGGGIVIDGHVYRGAATMAGEIGHIPIKWDGEICNCGHRGCFETLASATALAKAGQRVNLVSPRGVNQELTAEDVFTLAREGHVVASQVIQEMIYWLALGLTSVANTLNPDVIVIGGGVVLAGDALLVPLRKSFEELALPRVVRSCEIRAAQLGEKAGMLGAARLAWQYIDMNMD